MAHAQEPHELRVGVRGGARRAADHQAQGARHRQRFRRLRGAAVYLWHCDRDGRYSLYSEGLQAATTAAGKLRTSQLALPEAACRQVYATEGYGQSLQNLAQTSLDTDMVFGDGYSLQLATVTGSVAHGMTATLNVPV